MSSMLTTSLGKQGGRRYPQMNGIAGVQLQRASSRGQAPAPAVVGGDNAGIAIDLPAFGSNAPGTIVLGGGGQGGMT